MDAFPRPEVELAFGNGDDDLMAEQHSLEVRIRIVLAGLMMHVIGLARSKLFEPLHDVFPKTRLMVVHENAGGDVHGAHENEAVPQLRAFAKTLDFVGDIEDLVTLAGLHRKIFGMRDHAIII